MEPTTHRLDSTEMHKHLSDNQILAILTGISMVGLFGRLKIERTTFQRRNLTIKTTFSCIANIQEV